MPAYQNYTKRSANNACLAEARGVAGKAVIELQDPTTTTGTTGTALNSLYSTASACQGAKVQAPAAAALSAIDTGKVKLSDTQVTFTPKAPGDKQIVCDIANGGSCKVSDTVITGR